jgi:hypothetical protein
MTHAAESNDLRESTSRRRGIGWGGWLAIAGLVLFGLGLLQIALAFDAMTVDQPRQWIPIYSALVVIALLAVGLVLRWRLAYVGAMAAGLYGLVSALPRLIAGVRRLMDLRPRHHRASDHGCRRTLARVAPLLACRGMKL